MPGDGHTSLAQSSGAGPDQDKRSMTMSHGSPQVVHVVDDDELVRQVIKLWLERVGLATKGYSSAEEFRTAYQPANVECVLLDLQLHGASGLDLQEALNSRHFQTPLVVISGYSDTATVVRAMRAGAIDFLEKPLDEEILVRTVRGALEKDRLAKGRSADLLRRLAQLTPRENEVLTLLVAAKTTAEIASSLSIDPRAVEEHSARVFEKLEVESVPALIWLMLSLRR
jgi:two-component system, LuxR family, response regulator FixJ